MPANDRQVGGSHYQTRVQHWDYVLANGIPYLEAQIIKYLTRWRKKDGTRDLKKAKHFLEKLFEVNGIPWEEPEAKPSPEDWGRADIDSGIASCRFAGEGGSSERVLGGGVLAREVGTATAKCAALTQEQARGPFPAHR